jgi:hypothetical protein
MGLPALRKGRTQGHVATGTFTARQNHGVPGESTAMKREPQANLPLKRMLVNHWQGLARPRPIESRLVRARGDLARYQVASTRAGAARFLVTANTSTHQIASLNRSADLQSP